LSIKYNQVALFLGFIFPLILLIFKFDLNEITIILWPSWIFLIGLGGKITGIGDYIFIIFSIAVNMLIYSFVAFTLRKLFCKFSGKAL
jgi:hypothetical protein